MIEQAAKSQFADSNPLDAPPARTRGPSSSEACATAAVGAESPSLQNSEASAAAADSAVAAGCVPPKAGVETQLDAKARDGGAAYQTVRGGDPSLRSRAGAAVTERALVAEIRARWGHLLARLAGKSSVPEAFLAALVANESGGRADARRFEPRVFAELVAVEAGTRASSAGLTREKLAGKSRAELGALATSWGLTQVMGFHALARGVGLPDESDRPTAGGRGTSPQPHAQGSLLDPETNLTTALRMLAEFAERFGLDLAHDFEALLRAWNTGSPVGRTFDPDYVARGLARMELYREGGPPEEAGGAAAKAAAPGAGKSAPGTNHA